MSDELKPCPMCGGDVIYFWCGVAPSNHCFKCGECGVLTASFKTKEEAIAAWNRRTPEPMTSVVKWVRYDRTPETLPRMQQRVLVVCDGGIEVGRFIGGLEVYVNKIMSLEFTQGDIWTPLPTPPEGME